MATSVIYRMLISASEPPENSGESESEAAKKATKPTGDETVKAFGKKVAGYYAATSLVRTAVKTNVGLMDIYTGNDYQQRVISGSINIAESAFGLGTAFAVNPIAGVVTLATKAISLGAEAQKNKMEQYVQSLGAWQVRERAGGAFNRSRTSGQF